MAFFGLFESGTEGKEYKLNELEYSEIPFYKRPFKALVGTWGIVKPWEGLAPGSDTGCGIFGMVGCGTILAAGVFSLVMGVSFAWDKSWGIQETTYQAGPTEIEKAGNKYCSTLDVTIREARGLFGTKFGNEPAHVSEANLTTVEGACDDRWYRNITVNSRRKWVVENGDGKTTYKQHGDRFIGVGWLTNPSDVVLREDTLANLVNDHPQGSDYKPLVEKTAKAGFGGGEPELVTKYADTL